MGCGCRGQILQVDLGEGDSAGTGTPLPKKRRGEQPSGLALQVPASRLLVMRGGRRLSRGGAGRWSRRQPGSARQGSGTARSAGRSAGTGGSSHATRTGWGPPGAGLGASPVGQGRLSPTARVGPRSSTRELATPEHRDQHPKDRSSQCLHTLCPSRAGAAGFGVPGAGTWRPWGCPCRLSSTVLFLPAALSTRSTDHVFLSDQ